MKHHFFRRLPLFLMAALLVAALAVSGYAQEAEPEINTVQVFTVDELLEAIAPNTKIILSSGKYNLAEARNYGRGGGMYYYWASCFDGYELVISDLENFSIVGGDPLAVTICAEPRYANVLRFENVEGITLSDLVIGHTTGEGYCTGGVLDFTDCSDIEVLNSRLYGCGTLGVSLSNCQDFHMDNSDIYECSYGFAYLNNCDYALFENSKFYDCALISGGFEIYGSWNVAVINSEIFNNTEEYEASLFYTNSVGVYLGGLDIHDNAASLTGSSHCAVTMENCRLDYHGEIGKTPVSPDGTELTAADLSAMKLRTVKWQPAEKPTLPLVQEGQDGKIHVSTVDEFLAALGNDVIVYLEPGEYNLTQASDYGSSGGTYYGWEYTYDGYELIIRDVANLIIEADNADEVNIVTEPRYANVLRFDGASNLILRNVKVGHTEKPGVCSGGVVQLNQVNSAIVEGCKLFGCGTLGVEGLRCNNLSVYNCEIYECSSGAAWFFGCDTVRMEYCNIHDIGDEYFSGRIVYADSGCTNVQVDGEEIQAGANW